MNPLRFTHQFFHFTLADWQNFDAGSDEEKTERIFSEEIFKRRALKGGVNFTYTSAKEAFARILDWEARAGIRSIPINSPQYPGALLAHIPPERRPLYIHLRGQDFPEEKISVAIVGTRFPGDLGKESAASFSAYFSVQGLKVISGLAKGVDSIAHRENLRLGTVALLGGGVDEVYPRENSSLVEAILKNGGTVASPFPLGQIPLPQNFPIRNELIAAASAGTVVIEGAESSGAAVTGKLALAMGKSVVVLAQDYRSAFGRGALALHRAGANFVNGEEEALQSIFMRLGGFACNGVQPRSKKRTFTFSEFLAVTGATVPATLVLLEEGISTGRILRVGADRYRLGGRA